MSDRIEQELLAGKTILINTRGGSMRPLLREGKTQVLISPLQGPLKIGDLPLVRLKPGLYRLHRLVAAEGELLYTLGDHCTEAETVTADQVLGVVTEIWRGSRKIQLSGPGYRLYRWIWLHTQATRILLLRLRGRLVKLIKGGQIHGF